MQKPVLIASAALICAAVIGIAVYATGSAKKDAGGFARFPPVKVSLASGGRGGGSRWPPKRQDGSPASPSNRASRCSKGSCWCNSTTRWNRPS